MEVYTKGQPLSIRNSPLKAEFPTLDAAAKNSALIHHAELLHGRSPSGYAPKAGKLFCSVIQRQLYRTRDGSYCYCVWLLMSDSTKYRAAFYRQASIEALYDVWQRCAWPLKGKGASTRSRGRRRAYRASG